MYSIRAAIPEDAPELARLRWEYRSDDHHAQPHREFLQKCSAWLTDALKSDDWVVAVAASPDRCLCACMYLRIVNKVPIPGEIVRSWGYITSSYVDNKQRGQGLGSALLETLKQAALDRNLEFLIVWPSPDAAAFYGRAGFRLSSDVHNRADDYPSMELELF